MNRHYNLELYRSISITLTCFQPSKLSPSIAAIPIDRLKLRLLGRILLHLKILPNTLPRNVHNLDILNSRRDIDRGIKLTLNSMFDQLAQDTAEGLPAPRFGDHAAALDHAAQGGDGADLFADEGVDFVEKVRVRCCGEWTIVCACRAWLDEGEGEVAL